MRKYILAFIKAVISMVILHIYFLGGIYIIKVGYQHDFNENFVSKATNIYSNHLLSIILLSIFLIGGFTYMFYNQKHEKLIAHMAKKNGEKLKNNN